MPETDPLLFNPTHPTLTERRITEALLTGHRTVGFIAHIANTTYDDARRALAGMFRRGHFKVVGTPDDDRLHIELAAPGDSTVDPDLYWSIDAAFRGGARTIADIADSLGLPDDGALRLAVYLTLQAAIS